MYGTHIIRKYFGTILAYVCDAQNHIFPLVFAFVESKNKDSWARCLVQVQDDTVEMKHSIVIISNRQRGMVDDVSLVFSNAHNNYCVHHLVHNLNGETRDYLNMKYIWMVTR